jgi:predicted transcriptional regulator
MYLTNVQYASTPYVGGFFGSELTNLLVVGLVLTALGVVFTAFGALTTPPTKLTIKDVERLGLTGHTIKETATGTAKSTEIKSEDNPKPAPSVPPLGDTRTETVPRIRVSRLAKVILSDMPGGKTIEDISKETGVDESAVVQKVQELKTKGFLSDSGKLTQKGYEVLQLGK